MCHTAAGHYATRHLSRYHRISHPLAATSTHLLSNWREFSAILFSEKHKYGCFCLCTACVAATEPHTPLTLQPALKPEDRRLFVGMAVVWVLIVIVGAIPPDGGYNRGFSCPAKRNAPY